MSELTPEQREAIRRIGEKFRRSVEGLGNDITMTVTLSDGSERTAHIPAKKRSPRAVDGQG